MGIEIKDVQFTKECYFCGENDIIVIDLYYIIPQRTQTQKVIERMGIYGGIVLCKNCYTKLSTLLTNFADVKEIGLIDEKGIVWVANDPFVKQLIEKREEKSDHQSQ